VKNSILRAFKRSGAACLLCFSPGKKKIWINTFICYEDLKLPFTARGPCGKRTYCQAEHINLQRAAARGTSRNMQIKLFIVMQLGQPTPSALSSGLMDGAVLGYPEYLSIVPLSSLLFKLCLLCEISTEHVQRSTEGTACPPAGARPGKGQTTLPHTQFWFPL